MDRNEFANPWKRHPPVEESKVNAREVARQIFNICHANTVSWDIEAWLAGVGPRGAAARSSSCNYMHAAGALTCWVVNFDRPSGSESMGGEHQTNPSRYQDRKGKHWGSILGWYSAACHRRSDIHCLHGESEEKRKRGFDSHASKIIQTPCTLQWTNTNQRPIQHASAVFWLSRGWLPSPCSGTTSQAPACPARASPAKETIRTNRFFAP